MRYDDLLNLKRPTSRKHPPMSRVSRAAQFAPFASLSGYDAVIEETARLTQRQIVPTEEERAAINRQLCLWAEHIRERPTVTLTFFVPDERKAGGAYVTHTGRLQKVDALGQTLVFEDGTAVPFAAIAPIDLP